MLLFLFSSEFDLLGEFVFEQGALQRFSLSSRGRTQLETVVEHWQAQGIELIERVPVVQEEQANLITTRRFVTFNQPEAEAAVRCWAVEKDYLCLDVPERLLPQWEKLCLLDLQPEERFASLRALREGSHKIVEAWDTALDKTLQAQKTRVR